MTEYLSLPEAAHRYNLSEKTLHNWINKRWLQADKMLVNGRNQYLIDTSKLETVIDERNMLAPIRARSSTSQNDTDAIARIEALEKRVAKLERLLEYKVQSPPIAETPVPSLPLPEPKTKRQHYANPDKESNPLPDGCVSFFQFQHGISDGTAGRWKREQTSDLVQIGSWHGPSGHQVKVILTPDGQRAYYLWAKDRPGFVGCDDCPHLPT